MQDLISRQAAIDALNGEINITGRANAEAVRGYVRLVKDRLERLPSAERRGRWIVVSDGYGNGEATACICECSECKDTIWVYKKSDRKWKYCPNCGARMDGGENG